MAKKKGTLKTSPKLQQAELYKNVTIVQTKIIQKISKLKKNKVKDCWCQHLVKLQPLEQVSYDPKINYYDKFWKQSFLLMSFMHKFKQYKQRIIDLQKQVIHIQKRFKERQTLLSSEILLSNKRSSKGLKKTKIQDSNEEIIQNYIEQLQQEIDEAQSNRAQVLQQQNPQNVSNFIGTNSMLSPQLQFLKTNNYPSNLL